MNLEKLSNNVIDLVLSNIVSDYMSVLFYIHLVKDSLIFFRGFW